MNTKLKEITIVLLIIVLIKIDPVYAYSNDYSQEEMKENLTYCVNYFYEGIIDINNTDCYYNEPYGKKINTFIDKPKEGYVFDSFDPITVLDIEENIMNVYYKKEEIGEITPPKTGINNKNISETIFLFSILLGGFFITLSLKYKE